MTTPKPLTPADQLRALAADIPEEYRGPWRWHGQVGLQHILTTVRHGLLYVMGARRLGMNRAQMEFADRRGDEKYHTMKPAKDLAIREVPYRDDIVGIDNPFARWVAAASPNAVIEALDAERAARQATDTSNPYVAGDDWKRDIAWQEGYDVARQAPDSGLREAARAMRVPAADIRAALANLRGPVTRDEAIVMACADAVAGAMERAAIAADTAHVHDPDRCAECSDLNDRAYDRGVQAEYARLAKERDQG